VKVEAVDGPCPTADTPSVTHARSEVDRLADDVVTLGRRGLPGEEYYRELGARLRRVIDCDALCWHTLDPETLPDDQRCAEELISAGVLTRDAAPAAGEALVANE
jgi:hypothetical protein